MKLCGQCKKQRREKYEAPSATESVLKAMVDGLKENQGDSMGELVRDPDFVIEISGTREEVVKMIRGDE